MSNTAPDTDITGTGITKLTAEQIEKGCPARLQQIGKEITARLAKADKKTQEANDHLIAVNQLLAEAKGLCDSGGFQKFRELFCPQLGKSQAYAMLAIAAGRKTIEQHRSEETKRKQKTRERQKAAANSGTVPEKLQPLNQTGAAAKADSTVERDRKACVALDLKVRGAERELAQWLSDHPGTASETAPVEHSDADQQNDPLVVDRNEDEIEATSWFSSKIKPIFEGSIKNDEAKSALAIAQFKRDCARVLPQLTIKDLETAQDIFTAIDALKWEVEDDKFKAKRARADAKRIKWEASHPEEAKNKAREQAQHDAMENDIEDAKAEAKENGERWGDIKDEWIEEWIADNWGAEQEGEFGKDFQERWAREHGATNCPETSISLRGEQC